MLCATPPGVSQQSGQPATPTPTPEGLIHLDVAVVTHPSARPVLGLRPDDFSVLDNGQPAKIVSFHPYNDRAGDPPVAITVVLDTLRVSHETEAFERKHLEAFLLQNDGHLPQPVSLVLLADSGLWRVGQPSTDGKALAEDLAHNHITSWNPDEHKSPDQTWQETQTSSVHMAGVIQNYTAVGSASESGLRAMAAIAAAARREPGRKLLVWIGPAWGMGSATSPEEVIASKHDRQTAFDRIVWFSTLFRLARMTVCDDPVGASDPNTAASFPESALRPAESPDHLNPDDGKNGILELNRRVLAIASGGAVVEGSKAVDQLNECVRESHAAYTLTFNPAPAEHADEYHALQVNLRDANLIAHTNTGYYGQPWYSDAADPTIRRVTLADLDAFLRDAASMPDNDVARQLNHIELTEAATDAQIDAWTETLRGKKSREALLALVDPSVFLDRPPQDTPADPPPSPEEQRSMAALATRYVKQTIPRLPNFFARRTEADYEETPAFYKGGGRFSGAEALHQTDGSRTAVVFRNGAEVVDPKLLQRAREKGNLSTYGTFGPVLGAVENALATGVVWSRWEKDPAGNRLAVFRYSVPAADSGSKIGGCCLPDGDGRQNFTQTTAYHGEVVIDPATGAVMRVLIEQDLAGFVPADRADLMVAYGPVMIGDKTYICPLHSVSLLRTRSLNTMSEWDGEGFLTWGPYATKLNDFRFDDYHLFRAKVRILPGVTPASASQ